MLRYMIAKDTVSLGALLSDDSVLVHMTGHRQSKGEYLREIASGVLNYYSAQTDSIDITVLADYSIENADCAAKTLEDAGFEIRTIRTDLGNKEDILELVRFATSLGPVKYLINAAGVSPSQAPVEKILQVDLYGTSVLLEEFGKVIAEGGSGVVISSQSGHRLPALSLEENEALATAPVEELLHLPFIQSITDTLKAYQYSKRCNVLRVAGEACKWGKRGATVNSISPGIIITPLANDELHGPRAWTAS